MDSKTNLIIILIVLWGLLATGLSIYLWNENQGLKETNSILSKSIGVHKKLVGNEYKSYQAINDCFVVQKGLCNPEDFKSKLQALGDEADELYHQISAFEQQLRSQRP